MQLLTKNTSNSKYVVATPFSKRGKTKIKLYSDESRQRKRKAWSWFTRIYITCRLKVWEEKPVNVHKGGHTVSFTTQIFSYKNKNRFQGFFVDIFVLVKKFWQSLQMERIKKNWSKRMTNDAKVQNRFNPTRWVSQHNAASGSSACQTVGTLTNELH